MNSNCPTPCQGRGKWSIKFSCANSPQDQDSSAFIKKPRDHHNLPESRENTIHTHVWIAQVVPSVSLVRPCLPSLTLFFYFQGVFWQESPSQGKLGNSVVTLFVMLSHLALCKALITRKGGIDQLIINSTLQKKHFCNRALSGRSSIKGVAGSVSMSGICICQNRLCMLSAQTFHICFCLFPC